jgi:hypothetical protein
MAFGSPHQHLCPRHEHTGNVAEPVVPCRRHDVQGHATVVLLDPRTNATGRLEGNDLLVVIGRPCIAMKKTRIRKRIRKQERKRARCCAENYITKTAAPGPPFFPSVLAAQVPAGTARAHHEGQA